MNLAFRNQTGEFVCFGQLLDCEKEITKVGTCWAIDCK